jgi:excisionase family DNA binding protein
MADEDEIYTYVQAGAFLNLKVPTLYSKVSRREIPHIRVGRRLVRFSRNELKAWLAARRVEVGCMGASPNSVAAA